jgi:branched-chain amino acid transport system ATP-binding protein
MLSLRSIDVFRGASHVLRDLSLDVGESEVVCLVGRNGAGKTTTLETIMGFLEPQQGSIEFEGQRLDGVATHQRAKRGLGYSPDDCGIFSKLTVGENLMMSLWIGEQQTDRRGSIQHHPREAAFHVFPELRDLLARPGLHLSGGQRKMLAVARAMMLAPKLLLLDEAFEGLSPMVVARFTEAVIKIKSMGISILMAESQFGAAARIADRLCVVDRGEKIFDGTPGTALSDGAVLKVLHG